MPIRVLEYYIHDLLGFSYDNYPDHGFCKMYYGTLKFTEINYVVFLEV